MGNIIRVLNAYVCLLESTMNKTQIDFVNQCFELQFGLIKMHITNASVVRCRTIFGLVSLFPAGAHNKYNWLPPGSRS